MEKQTINKRKRVFSLQPNKSPKTIFVRRSVSHLVPALQKINMNINSSQINYQSFEQTVKHEVHMAFAWSRFLQHKLVYCPRDDPISTSSSSKTLENQSNKHQDCHDGEIKKRLEELQKLLPGGEEMNMDDILNEIGNYIVCLELQMVVLKSLVQDATS